MREANGILREKMEAKPAEQSGTMGQEYNRKAIKVKKKKWHCKRVHVFLFHHPIAARPAPVIPSAKQAIGPSRQRNLALIIGAW